MRTKPNFSRLLPVRVCTPKCCPITSWNYTENLSQHIRETARELAGRDEALDGTVVHFRLI